MQTFISRTLNGTGSALYLGLGMQPDWVRLKNLESSTIYELFWSINMRSSEQVEGLLYTDGVPAALTFGNGVAVYRGGDFLASGSSAYLIDDSDNDKRDNGSLGQINEWTLDTAANRTGSFNVGANTTYVGEALTSIGVPWIMHQW